MKSSTRKYNMVIFGATGVTGKHVIWEVIQTLEALSDSEKFTWAIAGRSISGLEKVLKESEKETGKDLSKIEILIADVKEESSILEMAKSCEIVVNCVGPYMLYGEPVVKACVQEGTHHVDISAEALFNYKMYKKYNKIAEESGSIVVGACGYCCIPSDFAATYLKNHFDGDLNSIESVQAMEKDNLLDLKIHYGTYHSILLVAHKLFELSALQKEMFPDPLPEYEQKQTFKPLHYNEDLKSWCVMLPHPDISFVEMTQRLKLQERDGKDESLPHQTQIHLKVPNIFWALLLFILQLILPFIVYFKPIQKFAENNPRLCSLGVISRQEPTKEEMDIEFSWTLIGEGWDSALTKVDKHYKYLKPNKKLVLKMKGRNPAYGATSTMLVQSAVTILKEKNQIPNKGGIYTPGLAFGKTKLADRLHKRGFTFTLEKPILSFKF